jgi:hypothetical protein
MGYTMLDILNFLSLHYGHGGHSNLKHSCKASLKYLRMLLKCYFKILVGLSNNMAAA